MKSIKQLLESELKDNEASYAEYLTLVEFAKPYEGKRITRAIGNKLPAGYKLQDSYSGLEIVAPSGRKHSFIRKEDMDNFTLQKFADFNPPYSRGASERVEKLKSILDNPKKLKKCEEYFEGMKKAYDELKKLAKKSEDEFGSYENPAYYEILKEHKMSNEIISDLRFDKDLDNLNYAKGGKAGKGRVEGDYGIGDLVFVKGVGSSGLVGLVTSDIKEEDGESGHDVYFRGLSGSTYFMPEGDIEDILAGHLYLAQDKGDLMHYPSIAKKLGITINSKYEDEIAQDEMGKGGKAGKKLPDRVYWALNSLDTRLVDVDLSVSKTTGDSYGLTVGKAKKGTDDRHEGFKFMIEKQDEGTEERIVWDYLKKNNVTKISKDEMEKGGEVGNLESIYKKYSDKDYWDTAHDIKRKKEERDYFAQKGGEKAKATTDAEIEKFYAEKERSDFFGYAEKVKKALDSKDSRWLNANMRANQKVTLELVEHYTGEKAGKNQKEINAWIEKFISVPALGRGGRATRIEGRIDWLITG
jgi:hypothetical protein